MGRVLFIICSIDDLLPIKLIASTCRGTCADTCIIMSYLLPKSSAKEFQLKQYWDSFFARKTSAFEWYGEYADLCHNLHKYVKTSSKILMVGCGNSKLSEALYDVGFCKIENIDISDVVIRQMKSKNRDRGGMLFVKMDVTEMTYSDLTFDCALDKGTLDAILSSSDDGTALKVERMFKEIKRVLKVSGRYICITLAQVHVLKQLLLFFQTGWLIRVHKVKLDVPDDGGMGGALPVFVFVFTKMVQREDLPPMKVNGLLLVRCSAL